MKKHFLILLLLIFSNNLIAQNDCFQNFYQKGIAAFQLDDFETAIKNLKAAKVCPDKPANNDVDDKIVEAQNGYINAIRKERKRAQSLALTAKSILELQKNDNTTTAFRYAQYALEKDDNSESRTAFYEAAYQLEAQGRRLVYSKNFEPLEENSGYIKNVDFSPQGNFITLLSSKREALIFDLEGQLVASRKMFFNDFDRNFLSANETAIALVDKDYALHVDVFSTNENSEPKALFSAKREGKNVASMTFSPKGNYFAVGYPDGLTKLFSATGILIAELKGHDQSIRSLSFSQDDSLLLTASSRGVIGIWRTDGSLIDTIVTTKIYDPEVLISPDKKHILISSSHRRARLLTIEGREIFRTEGYFRKFSRRNFSKKSDYVTLGNTLYNLNPGSYYGKIVKVFPAWIENLYFSKNDKLLLASGANRNAQLWIRNYEWEVYANLGGHTDHIVSAVFSPDEKSIVTASYDATVKIWPIETRLASTIYEVGKVLRPMTFEDSTLLLTHKGTDLNLWNATSGYKAFYSLPGKDVIQQSKDGKLLLTLDEDVANIWTFDPFGEGIRNIAGVSTFEDIHLAAFSNNKRYVAAYLRNQTFSSLILWDLETHKTRALSGWSNRITAVEWTADDKQLLAGTSGGEVFIWNTDQDLDKMELQKKWMAHDENPVSSIAVSPDGALIATGSWDTTTKLWNAEKEHLLTLRGHKMEINSLDFSADNRFIITASEDRSAKIWDTKGQFIVSLEGYFSDVKRAYFSPDGDYVVTNYGDGTIRIWPFNPAFVNEIISKLSTIDLSKTEKAKYGVE